MSRLFRPYRSIGVVAADASPPLTPLPHHFQKRGTESFITLSIGKQLHTLNCSHHLRTAFVGPLHPHRIRALDKRKDVAVVAAGLDIFVWNDAALLHTLSGHHSKPPDFLLLFGDSHLISCGKGPGRTIRIWNFLSGTLFDSFPLGPHFSVTALLHPATYLNKILFGAAAGSMQLWNIKTKKLIYSFQNDWGAPITVLAQSTAVDVVAVGLENGKIILHNLKLDETVMQFLHSPGPITSLSFRTDDRPVMISGNSKGEIAMWDLQKQAFSGILRTAHGSSVSAVVVLPGEPVMISVGADNAIKMWIFDQNSEVSARLLRYRSGHGQPPCLIRFYGCTHSLISAGKDRAIRVSSLTKDQRSCEMSQGKGLLKRAQKFKISAEELKLAAVTDLCACPTQMRHWNDIVTAHEGDVCAYTWSFEKRAMGNHALSCKCQHPAPITAVAISFCGNFALLGCRNGQIEKYNMQSGIHRGSYGDPNGHSGEITGLVTDCLNRYLLSGSLDGNINIWDFSSRKLQSSVCVGFPVTKMISNRENGLFATASDDLVARVFDLSTKVIARRFAGHSDRISDLAFSADCRWLVTASMDCTVRVWDIPSGLLLDSMSVAKPVVSLCFSPFGDFLATCHVGKRDIFLWSNRSCYSDVSLLQPSRMNEIPVVVSLPTPATSNCADDSSDDPKKVEENRGKFQDYDFSSDYITFSRLPKSHWSTLANLEDIKERNKPIEPPKAPEQVPFFIPTRPGLEPDFLSPLQAAELNSKETLLNDSAEPTRKKSRILDGSTPVSTQVSRMLASKQYTELLRYLMKLSPSAVDLEIRSLSVLKDFQEIKLMLDFFKTQLDTNVNFELIQAYMNCFLKAHGDCIIQERSLLPHLKALLETHKKSWSRLERIFQYNCFMTSHLSGLHF